MKTLLKIFVYLIMLLAVYKFYINNLKKNKIDFDFADYKIYHSGFNNKSLNDSMIFFYFNPECSPCLKEGTFINDNIDNVFFNDKTVFFVSASSKTEELEQYIKKINFKNRNYMLIDNQKKFLKKFNHFNLYESYPLIIKADNNNFKITNFNYIKNSIK